MNMKIRQYINGMATACLLAWGAWGLTGCAKEAHMDEYQPQQEQKSKDTDQEEPLSDEVSEKLNTIPGVSDVQIQVTQDGKEKGYYFAVDQLIDHNDASKGTFKQRCFLSFEGYERPVVMETLGYAMADAIDDILDQDLVEYLKANYLEVEHRYFGKSLPEDFDNTDFTYLYTDQAAADLHSIVTLMQKHLFPRSNKWVATGTSKGGITSTLYAYYSDQNDWDDIDLYIPFCAPFVTSKTSPCEDINIGWYLIARCGYGYKAGTTEAVAYQRLCKIPAAISGNEALRNACMREFHQSNPDMYQDILSAYDSDKMEQAATAGVIYTFYSNLFNKFSYIPFGLWAKYVPDPAKATDADASDEEIQEMVNMVFQTSEQLRKQLNPDEEKQASSRSPLMTDEEILKIRKEDKTMPYSVQVMRELGNFRYDFQLVDGTFLTAQLAADVAYLASADYLYGTRYKGQWDGGKLMKAVRNWAKTEQTQPIIFVYSYNDPWTGAAIDDAVHNPTRQVWKVVNSIGTHDCAFLKENQCDAAASKAIKDAISAVLNLPD